MFRILAQPPGDGEKEGSLRDLSVGTCVRLTRRSACHALLRLDLMQRPTKLFDTCHYPLHPIERSARTFRSRVTL